VRIEGKYPDIKGFEGFQVNIEVCLIFTQTIVWGHFALWDLTFIQN
jgi:hypothetical protein